MEIWNNTHEIKFFDDALNFTPKEKLFYKRGDSFYAYIPKIYSGNETDVVQGRNTLMGKFTENFCQNLFAPIAKKYNLYAVNGVICPELGLDGKSSGDLAFCTENSTRQIAENIKLLFEVKMSIVNNYQCLSDNQILFLGDYNTHRGKPSILRSDSVLKAIGKSLNIRASSEKSNNIPLVVVGNSPITAHYKNKIEKLRQSGVIQHFLNIGYSDKFDSINHIDQSYLAVSDLKLLDQIIFHLLSSEMYYFSGMLPKQKLGKIITQSVNEVNSEEQIAEYFLNELRTLK